MVSRTLQSRLFHIALTAIFLCSSATIINSQSLVLPELKSNSKTIDGCGGIELGISSEFWRVRKGDTISLTAVTPYTDRRDFSYEWSVENAKIIAGINSKILTIKAGGAKTPGYVNATGFLSASVVLKFKNGSKECMLSDKFQMMIGKHRESNGSPNITEVKLSSSTVGVTCPPGMRCEYAGTEIGKPLIDVFVSSEDRENDPLSLVYKVSGGNIVGNGHNVKWDLSTVGIGTYTIAVGADDGFGILGKTFTRTVTVEGYFSCILCDCPPSEILSPDLSISIGKGTTFTANVRGPLVERMYKWTVSSGVIVSGQGTSEISVLLERANPDIEKLSVTVEIVSLDRCNCFSTESRTLPIEP